MSITLLGMRWYSCFLKKDDSNSSLQSQYTKDELDNMFLVCYNVGGRLLYSAFRNYLEFSRYQGLINCESKSFFEIIVGDRPQKPRFDIDNLDSCSDYKLLLSNLVKACSELVVEYTTSKSLNLQRDVLIYESVTPEGINRTFHVVLNNYYHQNNDQAKIFYQEVMNKLDEGYKEFIDSSVYSSRQQFRILGSRKPNSNRPKVHLSKWMYFDEEIEHVFDVVPNTPEHLESISLYESLISVVDASTLLCHPYRTESKGKKAHDSDIPDIPPEMAIKALQMYAQRGDMGIKDKKFPYKITSIRGGLVILKRIRMSRCPICDRVHTSENPFLLIVENEVYFYCRRADDKIYVGTLVQPIPEEEREERITVSQQHSLEMQSLAMLPNPHNGRKRPVTYLIPEWDGSIISACSGI